MKAVILAAGMATRLWPLTRTTPKSLLAVDGVPLLRRILDSLAAENVDKIIIVTGYLHEMIEEFARSHPAGDRIRFVYNNHYARTSNAFSLWLGLNEIEGDHTLVLDADILFEHGVLADVIRSPHPDALLLRRSEGLGEEEVKVECDREGFVVRIGKEVETVRATGESMGIEKFSPGTAGLLSGSLARRKEQKEFYEASFQELVSTGVRISTVEVGRRVCIEIDTEEDLRRADAMAKRIPPGHRKP